MKNKKYGCKHREPYSHDGGIYYKCTLRTFLDCIESYADYFYDAETECLKWEEEK